MSPSWYGYLLNTAQLTQRSFLKKIELLQAGFRTYNTVLDRCSTNSDTEAAPLAGPIHAYRAVQPNIPITRGATVSFLVIILMNCATVRQCHEENTGRYTTYTNLMTVSRREYGKGIPRKLTLRLSFLFLDSNCRSVMQIMT